MQQPVLLAGWAIPAESGFAWHLCSPSASRAKRTSATLILQHRIPSILEAGVGGRARFAWGGDAACSPGWAAAKLAAGLGEVAAWRVRTWRPLPSW